MIILITASLSSKIQSKVSLPEEFTFEELRSTLSRSSIFHKFSFALEFAQVSPFLITLMRISVKNRDDEIP